ncbi:MAG: hypothetical protein R3E90_12560 [Marinicella sp.]|nr:hypothetical protein [Xanthomonadales bacterium]
MYQRKLIQLLQEFNHKTNGHYSLSKLMNNTDYRNKTLLHHLLHGSPSIQKLVKQILSYEDVLHHEFMVDLLPKTKGSRMSKSWRLAIFAFACLTLAVGSLAIASKIESNREQRQQIYAE